MNRERLTKLRDHLAGLPDERVDMTEFASACGRRIPRSNDPEVVAKAVADCGTAACIAGWTCAVFPGEGEPRKGVERYAGEALGLTLLQRDALFCPPYFGRGVYTRSDAVSAIQSMLNHPNDDALPIWPERA